MKKIMALLLLVSIPVIACDKGCEEHQGVCACEAPSEKSVQTYTPSDEKPPRSGRPSYEASGIHADMPSMARSSVTVKDDMSDLFPNGGVGKAPNK